MKPLTFIEDFHSGEGIEGGWVEVGKSMEMSSKKNYTLKQEERVYDQQIWLPNAHMVDYYTEFMQLFIISRNNVFKT